MSRFLLVFGLLLALATAQGAAAQSSPTSVSRDEVLNSVGAADTFEIVCKGPAVFLCVRSEDRGTPDDPMFVSLVGTAPAIMVGATATTEIPAGQIDSVCLNRRSPSSSMKALATFTARHDAKLPATYNVVATCLDDIGASVPVKVKRKQDEVQF